jgi:hypothetical protein
MRGTFLCFAAALALLVGTGCGSGRTVAGPVSTPQTTNVDFATQIQPIFTRNCAITGCHAADTASGGMILDAGQAYTNLVGATSSEVAPEKRVQPGDSAHSYLYEKINKAQPTSGGQMPLGADPLPADQIALIKTWIDQGAKQSP